MDNKRVAAIKAEALRLGFTLRPLPPVVRDTLDLVEQGRTTSRQVADAAGISVATAHMRMRGAERAGVIVEAEVLGHPTGGVETHWRPSRALGIEAAP